MAGKALQLMRRHPRLMDAMWVLPFFGFSLLTVQGMVVPPDGVPRRPSGWVALIICMALVLPLIWRRRWPRAVFAVISLTAFGQWLAGYEPILANMSIMFGLYTVASRCTRRWGLAAAAVYAIGIVLAFWDGTWHSLATSKSALITSWVFGAGILVYGIYVYTRHAYLQSLEDRAERAERERDTQVQIAMAAERARIARELHDVVAHNVSVIVVQADGAAFAIDTDTDRARKALETISTTGRLALSEMRRLLGVLRETDDTGTYTPQPGVEQLTELVEQVRGAGLPLDFTVEGVPRALPPGLQLAVFRIIQEALTNTLKHAGPEATARVRLHYGDDALDIRVRDDGRGSAASLHDTKPGMLGDGLGHGLVGMRERAALYGGSVHAAPAPGGGFEVAVVLPLPPETPATALPATAPPTQTAPPDHAAFPAEAAPEGDEHGAESAEIVRTAGEAKP